MFWRPHSDDCSEKLVDLILLNLMVSFFVASGSEFGDTTISNVRPEYVQACILHQWTVVSQLCMFSEIVYSYSPPHTLTWTVIQEVS